MKLSVNFKTFKNILSKPYRWIEYLVEMNAKINYLPAINFIIF